MIRPVHPCSAFCPGWRIVLGIAQPCAKCWAKEPIRPTHIYYMSQPECQQAVELAERRKRA